MDGNDIKAAFDRIVDSRSCTIYIGGLTRREETWRVQLDGYFSADELEKIAALMREAE